MTETGTIRSSGIEAEVIISTSIERKRVENMNREQAIIDMVINRLEEGDIFYDVGANIGIFSLLACKKARDGFVYCFEPHKWNAVRLRENLELNYSDNAAVAEIALFDETGELPLEIRRKDTGEGKSHISWNGDDMVQCKTADSLDIKPPNIVKIDVEGAEVRVIKGMMEKLSHEDCRNVFIEAHPVKMETWYGDEVTDIFRLLSDCHFVISKIMKRGGEVFYHAEKL